MSELENTILVRELGKLGGFGAKLTARFLRAVEHTATLDVAAPPADVAQAAAAILGDVGQLTQEFAGSEQDHAVSAIVGSGGLSLNPTILHITVAGSAGGGSTVSIRGIAKEGLVSQQSAERAVEGVKGLLAEHYAAKAAGSA